MSVAIAAALAAALTAGQPHTVSELVVIPSKLVDELVVMPHAKCLEAAKVDAAAPRVVSTFPAEGQVVRPGLVVVRVTFDRPMTCSGFIMGAAPLPDPCPDTLQKLILTFDRRTVRTLCLVGPNTRYGVAVGGGLRQFVSLDGQRAEPVAIRFQTSDGPEVVSVPEALAEDTQAPVRARPIVPGEQRAEAAHVLPPARAEAAPREAPVAALASPAHGPAAAAGAAADAPHEISGLTVSPNKCLSYPRVRALWAERSGEIARSDEPLTSSLPLHRGGEIGGAAEAMSRRWTAPAPADGFDRDHSPAFEAGGFDANAALAPYPKGKAPRTTPNPGTEAALRRFFESLDAGAPDYGGMTPDLAAAVRAQWGGDKSTGLGKFLSLRFLYVSRHGLDVYEVDWTCAKGEWGVGPLDNQGRVGASVGRLVSYGAVNLPD